MLDPEAFDSEEEFKEAELAEGLRRGWKPVSADIPISKKISNAGKKVVDRILKKE